MIDIFSQNLYAQNTKLDVRTYDGEETQVIERNLLHNSCCVFSGCGIIVFCNPFYSDIESGAYYAKDQS